MSERFWDSVSLAQLFDRVTALEKKVADLDERTIGEVRLGPKHEAPTTEEINRVVDRITKASIQIDPSYPASMTLTDGNPVTLDHKEIDPATGMQKAYVVLSAEERAKGWVRPYRDAYVHNACGVITRMGIALSETYARDPKFYSGTFCVGCKAHFPLDQFVWEKDGQVVGS